MPAPSLQGRRAVESLRVMSSSQQCSIRRTSPSQTLSEGLKPWELPYVRRYVDRMVRSVNLIETLTTNGGLSERILSSSVVVDKKLPPLCVVVPIAGSGSSNWTPSAASGSFPLHGGVWDLWRCESHMVAEGLDSRVAHARARNLGRGEVDRSRLKGNEQ